MSSSRAPAPAIAATASAPRPDAAPSRAPAGSRRHFLAGLAAAAGAAPLPAVSAGGAPPGLPRGADPRTAHEVAERATVLDLARGRAFVGDAGAGAGAGLQGLISQDRGEPDLSADGWRLLPGAPLIPECLPDASAWTPVAGAGRGATVPAGGFRRTTYTGEGPGSRAVAAVIRDAPGVRHAVSFWYAAGGGGRACIASSVFDGGAGGSRLRGPVGELAPAPGNDGGAMEIVRQHPPVDGVHRIDFWFTPRADQPRGGLDIGLGPDARGSVVACGVNAFVGADFHEGFVAERGGRSRGTGGRLAGAALAAARAAGATTVIRADAPVDVTPDGLLLPAAETRAARATILPAPRPNTGPGGAARTVRTVDVLGEPFPFGLGVNLAGADYASADTVGGTAQGSGYSYQSNRQADYFIARGLPWLRVPFSWERVQPVRGAALRDADIGPLSRLIGHIHAAGGIPILDVHNYFVRHEGRRLVVGTDVPWAHWEDLWRRLALRFKDLPRACLNLMNEPVHAPTAQILEGMNRAARAIRETGARNLLMVPGNHYTGAHSWVSSDNDEVMIGFTDPLDNWCYDMHQYLDQNSSGHTLPAGRREADRSKFAVAGVGATRLRAATEWLRANRRRAFLGEFNWAEFLADGSEAPNGRAEGRALVEHLAANRDVWLGGAYWFSSENEGDNGLNVRPESYANPVDRPQVVTMRQVLGLR